MLDPPLLIASERTFFEFLTISLHSILFINLAFLIGFILLKNKISLA